MMTRFRPAPAPLHLTGRLTAGLVACLAGCFADPAVTPSSDSTSSDDTTAASVESSSGDDTSTGASGADASSSDATSADEGDPAPALIEVELDAFGDVPLGSTESRLARIINVGSLDAESVTVSTDPPFSVVNTSCGAVLAGGSQCAATIELDASILGPVDGTLRAGYRDRGAVASTDEPLPADVRGTTDELVINGGFESCEDNDPMMPPPPFPEGWENFGADPDSVWACQLADVAGNVDPLAGERMVGAFSGPDGDPYVLRQIIELAPYQSAISTGEVQVTFEGHATTLAPGNDQYSLELEYFSGEGAPLDAFNTDWLTADDDQGTWRQHTDTRVLHPMTEQVRIRLGCLKEAENNCDAFFDGITLTLTY